MHYVSNGYTWFDWNGERVGPDFRWHSRYPIFEEEVLAAKLKRSLNWAYDNYFSFENDLIVNAYTVLRIDSKEIYGLDEGFVMLQLLYTHPTKRGTGILKRFLNHAMNLAEEKEARLAAVCRPFQHISETTGEETPSIKNIARDFTEHPERLVYLPVKTDEGKAAQNKMVELLKSFCWTPVDLRATMSDPETFGDFAFWTGQEQTGK